MWAGSYGSLKMAQALMSTCLADSGCPSSGSWVTCTAAAPGSSAPSGEWQVRGSGLRQAGEWAGAQGTACASKLLPGLGEVRSVAETLWDKPPLGPRGKPEPEAAGTDTLNHRHGLTQTCSHGATLPARTPAMQGGHFLGPASPLRLKHG